MFGHNSLDNYTLPFRSDEECSFDKSDFTDWSICGGSSWTEYAQFRTQTFRNKGTPDECYANLEDLVKSIVTSMKDAGSNVHYYSFPEDESGNAGFTIEDRRECTPGSVESTEVEVEGCMRVDAINYNPDATVDDESCEYSTRPMFTNSDPEPVEATTIKEPVVESAGRDYLSIIAFLVASGVLGNGINYQYQITDRIKAFGTKIMERVS